MNNLRERWRRRRMYAEDARERLAVQYVDALEAELGKLKSSVEIYNKEAEILKDERDALTEAYIRAYNTGRFDLISELTVTWR